MECVIAIQLFKGGHSKAEWSAMHTTLVSSSKCSHAMSTLHAGLYFPVIILDGSTAFRRLGIPLSSTSNVQQE